MSRKVFLLDGYMHNDRVCGMIKEVIKKGKIDEKYEEKLI